jgi:16S rRNA (guanine966-N2)-methyltransferase
MAQRLKTESRARGAGQTPGTVRVIGGKWRGRRLPVVADPSLRPTPDRVRETLFNWLRPVIGGARCLDLFAGTGALGIEAVSQGASAATLVEADPAIAAQLRAVAAKLADPALTLVALPAETYLAGEPEPFDIVFLDPPYRSQLLDMALAKLWPDWLTPTSLIYVERPEAWAIPGAAAERFEIVHASRAGQVHYYLLRPLGERRPNKTTSQRET